VHLWVKLPGLTENDGDYAIHVNSIRSFCIPEVGSIILVNGRQRVVRSVSGHEFQPADVFPVNITFDNVGGVRYTDEECPRPRPQPRLIGKKLNEWDWNQMLNYAED